MQEACLRHLAASVRAAHKIHGFAGGFDAELSALFDKVRPLASTVLLGPTARLADTAEALCKAVAHASTQTLLLELLDRVDLSEAHETCMRFRPSCILAQCRGSLCTQQLRVDMCKMEVMCAGEASGQVLCQDLGAFAQAPIEGLQGSLSRHGALKQPGYSICNYILIGSQGCLLDDLGMQQQI